MQNLSIDTEKTNKKDILLEIEKLENSILLNNHGVNTVKDWQEFKIKSNELKVEYLKCTDFSEEIMLDIKDIGYLIIDNICKCINQIEENYKCKIRQEDICLIMCQIRVLCCNNNIKCKLIEISKSSECMIRDYNIVRGIDHEKDYYGESYVILSNPDLHNYFTKLVWCQKEICEETKQANEFVFGKILKR